jgi:poly-gamma-glutamate synthesis protein (capsule biosynthesis protein)
LIETVEALRRAGFKTAGAGRNLRDALQPAILDADGSSKLLVVAAGTADSGIPPHWAATDTRPGIVWLPDLSIQTADRIAELLLPLRNSGNLIVLSVHWGGNWGYEIPREQRLFARRLIDRGSVDVIHGHSSHHPKAIEIYRNKTILYGCGDFLNDYEGIAGYEEFRADLVLMYFVTLDPRTGDLLRLRMTPLKIKRFQLVRAGAQDTLWLAETLTREGRLVGAQAVLKDDNRLELEWRHQAG